MHEGKKTALCGGIIGRTQNSPDQQREETEEEKIRNCGEKVMFLFGLYEMK